MNSDIIFTFSSSNLIRTCGCCWWLLWQMWFSCKILQSEMRMWAKYEVARMLVLSLYVIMLYCNLGSWRFCTTKAGMLSSKLSPFQKLPNANSPFPDMSSKAFSISSMQLPQHSSDKMPSNLILKDPEWLLRTPSMLNPLNCLVIVFASFLLFFSFLTYCLAFRISLYGSLSKRNTTICKTKHWRQQDMTIQSTAIVFKSSMACSTSSWQRQIKITCHILQRNGFLDFRKREAMQVRNLSSSNSWHDTANYLKIY